jgi:hypothetical protein
LPHDLPLCGHAHHYCHDRYGNHSIDYCTPEKRFDGINSGKVKGDTQNSGYGKNRVESSRFPRFSAQPNRPFKRFRHCVSRRTSQNRNSEQAVPVQKRSKTLDAPSWLWSSIVDLIASHESNYLEHCRKYALRLDYLPALTKKIS